ncbi:MAG TPA: type II toxin-antitoxin system VapB family antitoxin [Terracidiphilus sp.]
MSLNIKDRETHDLVKELADLEGTTLTAAVKLAVKEKIEREKASRNGSEAPRKRKRSEILQAFACEFVSRVSPGKQIHSWDIDKLLYDEYGLPK